MYFAPNYSSSIDSFKACKVLRNFQGFWVFNFGAYTEIKNLENSEIFSYLQS